MDPSITRHRTEKYVGSQKLKTDHSIQVINFNNSHQSRLYIDSNDRSAGTIENRTYDNRGKIVRQDIAQIGTKKVLMYYNIPNVNTLNNEFKFTLQGEGLSTFTAIVPVGYYATINDFMTALITSMNNAQGLTTFSYNTLIFPGGLVSDTLPWTWELSSGISNNTLHGLQYFEGFTTSQTISPTMLYTRYIDILISRIKDAQISVNTYTKNKPYDNKEHVARIYVSEKAGQTGISEKIEVDFDIVDYFPYRKRQLTQFKISLYDEFGNYIYHETETIDGNNYEINYLKYNIELSLVS